MPFLIRHSWLAAFSSICRCSKCLNQRMLGEGAFEIICSDLLFQGPEAPKPNAEKREHYILVARLGSEPFSCPLSWVQRGLPQSPQHPQEGGSPSCSQASLPVVLYQYQAAWQISKPCSGASHTSPVSKTGSQGFLLIFYIQSRTESAQRLATVSKYAFLPPCG